MALFQYFWRFAQICKKFAAFALKIVFVIVSVVKLFRNNNKNNFSSKCCKFLANLCKSSEILEQCYVKWWLNYRINGYLSYSFSCTKKINLDWISGCFQASLERDFFAPLTWQIAINISTTKGIALYHIVAKCSWIRNCQKNLSLFHLVHFGSKIPFNCYDFKVQNSKFEVWWCQSAKLSENETNWHHQFLT